MSRIWAILQVIGQIILELFRRKTPENVTKREDAKQAKKIKRKLSNLKRTSNMRKTNVIGILKLVILLCVLLGGCGKSNWKPNSITYVPESNRVYIVRKGMKVETTEGIIASPYDGYLVSKPYLDND
jgi:hypothetical protein